MPPTVLSISDVFSICLRSGRPPVQDDDEVGTQDRATAVVWLDLQLLKAAIDLVESRGLRGTSVAVFDGPQNGHELLPVTTVEYSHGSPHVGGASPKASV